MNETINAVLIYLSSKTGLLPAVIISHDVGSRKDVYAALAEIESLDLVIKSLDRKGAAHYSMKQTIKDEIAALPPEFAGKPYEYFIHKSKSKEENEARKHWYETENARVQFEEFPETKRKANQSHTIAILSAAIAVITLMRQLMCNKPD